MSNLSEHDRAALERIERQLQSEDPRLAGLLARFDGKAGKRGPGHFARRLIRRRMLVVDIVGLCMFLLLPLLIAMLVR